MISNNTTYKLRSSKTSSEICNYEQSNAENGENNDIDWDLSESNNRSQGYLREGRFRNASSRSRITEFRPSTWTTDRKGFRSRGTVTRNRNEREGSNAFRKFHDSSRNSDTVGNSHHGKFYEMEKKTEIKLNLPEDTRISKLLRRLSMETDQNTSLVISKKLLEVLLLPDNAPYIRKAFHILGESMFEILQVSPGLQSKKQAARALGRMGYIMGQENDFERYQNWLFNKMTTSAEDMQILLMETLKETLVFEIKLPVIQEHTDNLLRNLVSIIENTESAPIFKISLDVLMSVVEVYPDNFFPFFRDTIDLLFGWHVDHTQPLSTIEFISNNLRRIPKHFQFNLEFSLNLIENFLEDIVNYSKQLPETGDSTYLEHITVLVLAMNTILKCLDKCINPNENKGVRSDLISTLVAQIIKTTSEALESFIPENLTIATNDCVAMLLTFLDTKTQTLVNSVYNLIELELSLVNELTEFTIISMLIFISKILKELSANLPVKLIEKLIGPKSELMKLRLSPFLDIQKSVILVYQALLNLKNVSLVQEAYRYVLGDFEVVYRKIIPECKPFTENNPFDDNDVEKYSEQEAENLVIFLLRCLSQLANASSIIVMWALKPSILELVAIHLLPYNQNLAQNYPDVQFGLMYLLFSHCRCYNHYISTSSLLSRNEENSNLTRFSITDGSKDDVPHSSPNSGNFTIILDVIYKTLSTDSGHEVVLLTLKWIKDVLCKSEVYLINIYNKENFVSITEVLVRCGYNQNQDVALHVCENLDKLLSYKHLPWSNTFLINVSDLCKLHMSSNKELLRAAYSKLASLIPWDVAVVEFNKTSSVNNSKHQNSTSKDYNSYMITMAQYLHSTGAIYTELSSSQFKKLMKFLLDPENDQNNINCLEEIFVSSLCLDIESQMNMELFYDLGMNSKNVLYNWATLEAAQFCVNSKLRTPLGKPNETFMKIEGALNTLGNELLSINKDKAAIKRDNHLTRIRVSLLLKFIEHLEKRIYNAAEGCAIAMPQPAKLVRTFFIANSNTCHEWITRIRMVIIHIALHAGEFNAVIRHANALLKEMTTSDKIQSSEFERCAIFMTLALLNLRETEAIYGLYVWCKNLRGKHGRKYSWIKYAGEQSSKKYETAIEGYRKVLHEMETTEENEVEEDMKKINLEIRNFIHDQIEACLKEFQHWFDTLTWHNSPENEQFNETHRKCWYYTNDWECASGFVELEGGTHELSVLSEWKTEDKPKSWSCYNTLSTAENNLYRIALQLSTNRISEDLNENIDLNLNLITNSIQEYLDIAPCEIFQTFSLLQYIGNGLKNVYNNIPANTVFLVSENFETEVSMIDSSILRKILWWSEYFGSMQNQGFNSFCSNLRLDIINRARKEKNFNLAYRQIYKFLEEKDLIINDQQSISNNLAVSVINKISDIKIWTMDTARAVSEVIKLLYTKEENKQDIFNLCAATSTSISKHTELYGGSELRTMSSKILLKLSSWMQNNDISVKDMNSHLGKLLLVLPDIALVDNNPSGIIPLNEMAIGKLLQFSVHQCVTLAKGWSSFGTWCYKWGKKIHGHSSTNSLTEDDCNAIKNLLPEDTNEEELLEIFKILSQNRNITEEEDLDSNSIKTSFMIKNQLQNIRPFQDAEDNYLEELLQIWRNTQKRIYNYYNLSAEAYFKYLHLLANSDNITKSMECTTITITLRLLRLIVRYALELQGTLEEGLKATPTQPWKVIIPQLFSRLNHPEAYVHHCVSDLLCRVAEDAPHLITFPAVVGALEGGVKFNFSEISLPKDCLSQVIEKDEEDDLNENEDDESDVEEVSSSLQSSFKVLVDTLSKQDPETISQVQLLVRELRRITLLWDELWLGTLLQHSSEITKREQQLEYEIEKVMDNPNLSEEEKISLIAEKHRIIVKPIIFVLEQLQEVTDVDPETPHEKMFKEKFSTEINTVIRKLKQPERPEKPHESLMPLKSLQKKFQQKIQKRSSYSLKMQDISPILANIRDTMIAMPGLISSKTTVTISHVSNVVSILPTKTKPKKLVFYGSDGQTYTYLFKGLEDLHLDERIMQFLNIANTMMAQNVDPTGQNLYRARHYSVIPLGPRSGLINWVEGTTPVFSLYKRWQQRELAKPNAKNANTTSAAVLRPSEMFYNKLNPLLVEHGVKNIENRKEWPLGSLKQVLTELMSETPSDLLAKELWCNSISASDWWNVTKRYSYSVAVMSIIGYIIGLGDRHLDNVLVDLTSGEVVHIDYNVCFEKGKTLRVPEKVPFRLTPNIRDALGVTGIEGIFRLACENVLKTMRKGRETLLTLLEAFVYDPLIDWTVGGEVLAGATFGNAPSVNSIKQSRKELEKEVTISMFNVRCTEMKTEWNENKDEILKELKILREILNEWLKVDKIIFDEENALQDLHQQMALVKEAEAHTSNMHPLHCLPARFDSYHKTKDALKNAKKDVHSLMTECQDHLESYNESLTAIDGPEMLNWLIDLKNVFAEDNLNVFDLVKEFLHNAGKNDVVTQCEESEIEITQLIQHQKASIQKCLQLLQEYKALIGQCPKSFIETHRIYMYLKWLAFMMENDSPASCERIYENFHNFLDNPSLSTNTLNFKVSLDNFYKEAISETNKLFEELSVNTADIQTLDNLYTTARTGITTFLGCEKNADKAFEFVIALELLVMNRNFLILETAAHRSGDWLIKLTSRDGDWFLDDLVLNSSRAVELMNNLPLVASEEHILFFQLFNCVRISNNIYRGLQELYFNFHTIILPESMKKIQSEDTSLKQIISDLNDLLKGVGMSIPEMTTQLVKMIPCLLMQMEIGSFYDFVLERVATLKTGFLTLINGQAETITSGRMLLMGFNGLFEKLTMEWNDLINALGSINLPNSWKSIDQVKDAKNISPHVCNSKVHSILEDIFLLKRLQAMSDFFNCCSEMCQSFEGTNSVAYNDDQLLKPIRQFIADFISKQLLGITTEHIAYVVCYLLQDLGFDVSEEIEQKDIGAESKVPLDDLYHKSGNIFLKQGIFSQNALSQASTLESNLKHAWIKIQETKKLQRKITLLQSTQLRLHTQITLVNFMYEEILVSFNLFTPIRSKFILDLKTEFTTLQLVREKLTQAAENQKVLIESAHQRLKWAKGANPEVGEISSAFENTVQLRESQLKMLEEISAKITKVSSVVLKHELLRNHCIETKTYDKTFLNSFEKWRMACQYNSVKNDVLTPTEESIMSLLTKDLTTSPKWLEKISEMITVIISKTQSKLSDEKINLFSIIDAILARLEVLKNTYNTHCRLMTDVKNLVKSMTKIDNYSASTQEFITQYRSYIENFSLIFQKFKKEHKREDVLEVIKCLEYMEINTGKVYEDLLGLEETRKMTLVRQDALCLSPTKNASLHKQESIAMKGQQRNAYAVSVWRRVKMKLEGRDPDPGRKCSAQEQVDYVIREATSLDNLALLYEGWTPWV